MQRIPHMTSSYGTDWADFREEINLLQYGGETLGSMRCAEKKIEWAQASSVTSRSQSLSHEGAKNQVGD
ncbi:hypothetical protein K3495_g9260 [Podosphaera aphanis]|nr:hypothetical protein K3495_g9260 [Podosphaera aphanis]